MVNRTGTGSSPQSAYSGNKWHQAMAFYFEVDLQPLGLQRKVDPRQARLPEGKRHGFFLQPRPSGKEKKNTMPKDIVTETCPAPECNLSEKDVERFMDEMRSYIALFAPAFQRTEQWEWSQAYVSGLLSDAARKNVERMALELGEKVRSMQYFIGQSPWKSDPVLAIHQKLVAESLGEADGVVLMDESGVVKQGADSVGVAAQ